MADLGKHKLTDALKDQPKVDGGDGKSVHPEQQPDPVNAENAVPNNSHVNAGFQSRDDFLVHIGRGHDTSGRGSQKG